MWRGGGLEAVLLMMHKAFVSVAVTPQVSFVSTFIRMQYQDIYIQTSLRGLSLITQRPQPNDIVECGHVRKQPYNYRC
jgi:hypothetical protein